MMNIGAHTQYEEFRQTDLEISKEIPSHWQVWKMAHAFQQISSGTTPDTGRVALYDGDISWLQTGDLTDGAVYETRKRITHLALKKYPTLKVYPVGSLVMAMYGATIGKLGMLQIPAATNQACCVFSRSEILTSDFAFYSLFAMRSHILSIAYGGGQPNISQQTIKALQLIVPPLEEQRAIAAFLDDKCAKIDEAVKIKEEQIARLRERRQIIIQDAVTRGLNPAAPMKESGINWIGKIPGHWGVLPLFTLAKVKSIANRPDLELLSVYLDRGVVPFADVEEKRTNTTSLDLSAYQVVDVGDLVLNNQQAWRGSVGVSAFRGIVSPAYIVLSLSQDFDSDFANYYFRIGTTVANYLISSKGVGTIQRNLYWPKLKRALVTIPPKSEQISIVKYIHANTQKIDAGIEIKNRQITALKEYKTSLINAAVTGKIKVV
jgi:restriction endonuclease S subunit